MKQILTIITIVLLIITICWISKIGYITYKQNETQKELQKSRIEYEIKKTENWIRYQKDINNIK